MPGAAACNDVGRRYYYRLLHYSILQFYNVMLMFFSVYRTGAHHRRAVHVIIYIEKYNDEYNIILQQTYNSLTSNPICIALIPFRTLATRRRRIFESICLPRVIGICFMVLCASYTGAQQRLLLLLLQPFVV